ncbi:MAG: hypothetical protein E6J59_00730 [Deltaproteobacteria bacterium]|nr:MAG: hypothetical protein E6J59_00730 [Deltaproteobacteria bacterium]
MLGRRPARSSAAIREAREVMELLLKITGSVPMEPVSMLLYGFDPDLIWPDTPNYVAEWGMADGSASR